MARKMRQSGVDWIGEIPEGWGMLALKHGFTIKSGATPSSDEADYYNGDIVWITPADYKTSDHYVSSGRRTITQSGLDSCSAVIVPAGSLIFSKRAPVGTVAISEVPLATNQGCLSCVPNGVVSTEFAYYVLSVCTEALELASSGTTFLEMSASAFANFKIPYPRLEEQIKLCKFLGEKSSLIEDALRDVRESISEYRLLKKTLVFEAVTGKNLKDKKVASGQDWLGDIPAAWDVRRIVNLYREVSERGDDSLPILSVSINTGVSDKELSDEEQERVFIRSEDKTKYKRVQPSDLTYNMMRAWQGAFGAVRVNGMVSPAYVVARPKVEMDSRYVEYLLRSPNATREMQRYSRGIADFRLRLYWPEFKNIRIPCPPLEEQKRIADMLDEKCGEIDAVIADKERLIADLETYKKSLIFEVVTGKREVA